jgi:hypothetical protein
MRKFLQGIQHWFRRRPPIGDLTEIEYEAVSLIAYEGRAAYARAREQAEYCLSRGSEAGCRFGFVATFCFSVSAIGMEVSVAEK